MKLYTYFMWIIWLIFLYLVYVVILGFGYLAGLLVFLTIVGGGIITQILYKYLYKKYVKFYSFILYPIVYIGIVFAFFLVPEIPTGLYEFSSGENKIVFQGMNHIGTKRYYEQVKNNIIKYKGLDYTIVYEGISMKETGSGSENKVDEKLLKIFDGTDFLKNKFLFFEGSMIDSETRRPENFNIDISNKEIQKLYDKKQENSESYGNENMSIQGTSESGGVINNFIYKFKQKHITFLDYKFITAHYNVGLYLSDIGTNVEKSILNSILKDYRDIYLYKGVIELEKEKIFIVYGEGHVDGFYNLLNHDNSWKAKKIQELYPYEL